MDLFDRSVSQGRQTLEFYGQLFHFQESFREQLSWQKVYGQCICQWRQCWKVLLSLDRLSGGVIFSECLKALVITDLSEGLPSVVVFLSM